MRCWDPPITADNVFSYKSDSVKGENNEPGVRRVAGGQEPIMGPEVTCKTERGRGGGVFVERCSNVAVRGPPNWAITRGMQTIVQEWEREPCADTSAPDLFTPSPECTKWPRLVLVIAMKLPSTHSKPEESSFVIF
jgi:hypothetical protein